MNNQQFRSLLNTGQKSDTGGTEQQYGEQNARLQHSNRNIGLLAPRTVRSSTTSSYSLKKDTQHGRPAKRFKSAAPKGSQVADGYVDRASQRQESTLETGDNDAKAKRIAAIEEQMKLGEISLETFEALREEITGGDISSTHLVKGLDRKLLERIKRGENVMSVSDKEPVDSENAEEALDDFGNREVVAVQRQQTEKRGTLDPSARKRTRDEIMADLKAQRKAAAEAKAAAEPSLDNRWRRVDEKRISRIEIDRKGREVLVIVDEDGIVTKKVRKAAVEKHNDDEMTVDKAKEVLGADIAVPSLPTVSEQPQAQDEDDDIFEGVGTEYNPLGQAEDDDDEDEDEDEYGAVERGNSSKVISHDRQVGKPASTEQSDTASRVRRNYFGDKQSEPDSTNTIATDMEAVIRKAARMADSQDRVDDSATAEEKARKARHAAMLSNRDRDLEDMDLGFGGSRNDDGEDAEGNDVKVRLSQWSAKDAAKKGSACDGEQEDGADDKNSGKQQKKKRSRKRKGDASNIGDIMKVIEGRKKKT